MKLKRPYSSERSCSPRRKEKNAVKSCFSWQSLARIARRYNESNPHDKIQIHSSHDKLWQAIRAKMPQCRDERCWIRAQYISEKDRQVLLEDFRAPLPQGKYDWLNTDDIERVLKRYERVFRTFVFLGAYPIDFQSVYADKFHPLNVAGLLRAGKRHAGLVLNLDRSDQPGSHWVAIFLDLKSKVMEFFDSYGVRAPKQVKAFFESLGRGWTYKENKTAHQRKGSECGVYSINFIVRRLSGASFERIVNDIIRDEEMNGYRTKYYFDQYEKYNNN